MANYTQHYQLHQWEGSDPFLRTDFNEDFQKIDSALEGKGNCRICFGSYTGNGKSGEESPTTLTLPFQPLVIFLDVDVVRSFNSIPEHFIFYQGQEKFQVPGYSGYYNTLLWQGNTVSWFFPDSSSSAQYHQFNAKDQAYTYLAIGE